MAAHGFKVVGVQAAMSSNAGANVGLHLNRRLRSQVIPDLDGVIVALKSWTSFTVNFVIQNSHRQSAFPEMQRLLRMITVAPATAAPEGSVISPLMRPNVVCAGNESAVKKKKAANDFIKICQFYR